MQVLLGVGASLSRVRRLMEAQRLERGGLTKRKRKKKRKLNIYRVREMPIGRLNTQPLCYHSSNSRTKKSQSRMGNRSDGANLTPVQSRRGRVLPAAPQGTAALRALPLVFHILFQLRSCWMYRGCHACSDGV